MSLSIAAIEYSNAIVCHALLASGASTRWLLNTLLWCRMWTAELYLTTLTDGKGYNEGGER